MLFLSNGPRIGNGQRGFRGREMVNWQLNGLSDKIYLNILRIENISRVGARLSIEQDDKVGIRRDNKVDIRRNDKASTRRND